MLFQLIHQCQLQPSVERQDAGEREVMKALWWTSWITGNPNPPWSFSLRYHEICSTIIPAAITFSWNVTWNKAALRGQRKWHFATRIKLNWVQYHCKVLRWFYMWLHWKLSNTNPNCYSNQIFGTISTNHIWRNPMWTLNFKFSSHMNMHLCCLNHETGHCDSVQGQGGAINFMSPELTFMGLYSAFCEAVPGMRHLCQTVCVKWWHYLTPILNDGWMDGWI